MVCLGGKQALYQQTRANMNKLTAKHEKQFVNDSDHPLCGLVWNLQGRNHIKQKKQNTSHTSLLFSCKQKWETPNHAKTLINVLSSSTESTTQCIFALLTTFSQHGWCENKAPEDGKLESTKLLLGSGRL